MMVAIEWFHSTTMFISIIKVLLFSEKNDLLNVSNEVKLCFTILFVHQNQSETDKNSN